MLKVLTHISTCTASSSPVSLLPLHLHVKVNNSSYESQDLLLSYRGKYCILISFFVCVYKNGFHSTTQNSSAKTGKAS